MITARLVRPVMLLLLSFAPARPAGAEPITIIPGTVNSFRNTQSPHDLGFAQGDTNQLGADVMPSAGTEITAVQGITSTGPCQPLAVNPNFCARQPAFSPSRMGAWALTFRNGSDTATITTPTLAGAETPVPFVVGVMASGSTFTPTFSFAIPAGFTPDAIRVNIFDRAVTLPIFGIKDVVHSQALPPTTTSFTVPATLSSGQPLRANNPYTLNIQLIETRGRVDFSSNNNALILRRSSAFFDFTPIAADIPGGVLVPPSLPPPNFTESAFETQLSALNDQFLATGGQPLTPTGCPEGRCPGPAGDQTAQSYLFDLFYAEPRLREVRKSADSLIFQTHLPTCAAGTPSTPERPCFDLATFGAIKADLDRAQGEVVTNNAARVVIGDAAEGSRLTGTTILQRPEQAVREALRGLFINRVFSFSSAELTDTRKAQIRALALLPDPPIVFPDSFTITYSPVSTTQTGQVIGIRGIDTELGPFAVLGFGATAQLDAGLLDFLGLQVGARTQAYFGVLGGVYALMEAEVLALQSDGRVELTFRGVTPAPFFQVDRASVQVSLSVSRVGAGQPLTMGVEVRNPLGNVDADLYVGALLPDGQTALFFSGPGVPGAAVSLSSPAQFPRMQAAPLGFAVSAPSFFQFAFPAAGVPPGTYRVFAALVRPGALADNRIAPDDILAFDLKEVVFAP